MNYKLKKFSILILSIIFVTVGFFVFFNKQLKLKEDNFKNVILIGWDGMQRNHLNELLEENKLPNFNKYFLENGSCVNTMITTGATQTKPGWAEILTGYNPSKTGVFSNKDYKPISKGYTIFERLEDYFGDENIITMFIAGKINNVGARGPHKLCVNCLTRDLITHHKLRYWDENSNELFPRNEEEKIVFEQRNGEPYFITKDNIDIYINALRQSQNVINKAFNYLDTYRNERFFMFLHYEEPDEQGHLYGENSQEYSEAIIQNDKLLEDIVLKLKQLNIFDNTILYLTTDHGIDEGQMSHRKAPETFFCSSEKGLIKDGDRKDITPTILYRYGIDINKIKPILAGIPLMEITNNPVRIGYFHGGRVNKIYQAYVNQYFEKEGVNVKLYTKFLHEEEIFEVPKTHEERKKMSKDKYFGKMSGIEIVEKIMEGKLDGGTIGESSFVLSINNGLPIVAVAMLGYDAIPGKAIIIRSDIKIDSPEDLKGKTLISRRAGPGDVIFLKEFLEDEGLDPDKDITIIDQVNDDDYLYRWLQEKKVEGGLYHLLGARKLVLSDVAYIYRPMNWMNSQLSHAVLVFHKDYLENHKEEVQKVVTAYMKRIAYEKNLPEEEKDSSWDKAFMMVGKFEGMSIPQYNLPPKLKSNLLEEMQDLLLKYNEIEKKINIEEYLDYSFVDRAMEEIK